MSVSRIPAHIGIIMDGNRRWADAHGLNRIDGHERGIEALRRTVDICGNRGVKVVTAYAFSSENWNRPEWEIEGLFGLFGHFVVSERPNLLRNKIRLSAIGRRDRMPAAVRERLEETEELTRHLGSLHLRLAVDYGGRQEIVRAVRALAERAKAGTLDPEAIDEDALRASFESEACEDPDLIIRTGGEQRLSNFMLWQSCYSELYFCDTLWPDFGEAEIDRALADFARRERRYGGRPDEGAVIESLAAKLFGD
jgi:undecaprenyl diphosphate synthase